MSALKTILVTGAASGIGRATTKLFASRGWRVVAVDVNEPALKALVGEASEFVVPIVGDVGTRDGASAILASAVTGTGGTLDCLFNCAGLLEMGPHHSIPPERVDHMLAVNINGVVNCIDAALPILRATSGAHIVNMSSAAAEYGMPDLAAYSASKFFVRGFTEALNIELEPLGIQVSAVLVAYVRTPMVTEAKVKATLIEKAAIKKEPEQVAEVVWQAAHGSKVLWRVGPDAFVLNAASRIFGTSVRRFYKSFSGY